MSYANFGYEFNYGPGEPIYVMRHSDGRYWHETGWQRTRRGATRYTMKQTFLLSLAASSEWVQAGQRWPINEEPWQQNTSNSTGPTS